MANFPFNYFFLIYICRSIFFTILFDDTDSACTSAGLFVKTPICPSTQKIVIWPPSEGTVCLPLLIVSQVESKGFPKGFMADKSSVIINLLSLPLRAKFVPLTLVSCRMQLIFSKGKLQKSRRHINLGRGYPRRKIEKNKWKASVSLYEPFIKLKIFFFHYH